MLILRCFFLIILIFPLFNYSQDYKNDYKNQLIIVEGDSIPSSGISLKEVIVFQPLKFETQNELLNYIILRRKVFRVYPYAKLAAERLIILNERLDKIESKRRRRKYIKMMEKFIYDEFSNELKKFKRSEGEILIKLISRQTGNTPFKLIKELRTGFRAFLYQTTASFFKLSLKETYNPEKIKNDYLIEDILQRAFADKYIEEQESALDFNLDRLYGIWKK